MTLMLAVAIAAIVDDDDGDCNNVSFLAVLWALFEKKKTKRKSMKRKKTFDHILEKKNYMCSFKFTSSLYGYYYVL